MLFEMLDRAGRREPDYKVVKGMWEVLALRSKWGQPKCNLTDPMKYHDARFYDAAMKR
jgi:hypothetical protein